MINSIIRGDCFEVMKRIEDGTIDITVTSPPYNVDLGNNKYRKAGYDIYKDNKEHNEYLEWLSGIFELVYKKTKAGGRIAINVNDGKNGAIPTSSDIIQFMTKDIGWTPMAHIIWNKNTTSNRAAWGSWLSPSCPSFPTTFERILVFAKESKKLSYKGETDLERDEFIKWANSIWTFAPEKKMKRYGHNAMFPEELPKRLIKMLSWKGALVLDPFVGVGTTCVAAKKLGRDYIGVEISEDYAEEARKRIEAIGC
jgi:DNA modification methylase